VKTMGGKMGANLRCEPLRSFVETTDANWPTPSGGSAAAGWRWTNWSYRPSADVQRDAGTDCSTAFPAIGLGAAAGESLPRAANASLVVPR